MVEQATPDRGQGEATQDRGQDEATPDRGQSGAAPEQGQGNGRPVRAQSGATPEQGAVQIVRGAIPDRLIDDALRLLHLDIVERGASADELGEWLWGAHWFPHLRYDPAILALERALAPEWRTGELCEPQILLQFPHTGPEPEITFHLDREPDWAGERRYLRIVGVPLSRWRADNGGLLVRVGHSALAVELDPGDAVMMAPDQWHSGGINRTGAVRYGVYFRWLEPAAADSSASRTTRVPSPSSRNGSQT